MGRMVNGDYYPIINTFNTIIDTFFELHLHSRFNQYSGRHYYKYVESGIFLVTDRFVSPQL